MVNYSPLARTFLCCAILLAACGGASSPTPASPSATLPPPPTATPTLQATAPPSPLSPTPQATALRSPLSPTPSLTPPPEAQVCSPLQGAVLSDLPGMVVNPFAPPSRPGSDDPHHGIDLAQVGAGNIALAGLPVQAVLAGQVAAVIVDRFPYGNAVIIETPLERLPGRWWEVLALPTPAPTLAFIPALTCPTPEHPLAWNEDARSLYLLYAHMQSPPSPQPDETVACGQALGAIGDSGNALNPHLHLEVRIGPSGVRIPSLAHYDPSATVDEMAYYCAWRVSGLFQLVDPMDILGQ